MVLPALLDGDGPVLFQSLAIMEYLDETHPQPPLLPKEPRARARVRGLAQIVLSTAERNETAQRFFAELGFRRTMAEMTRELDR